MERCWGVLVSDHCNSGDENSHGVGGYLVEKVFGVVVSGRFTPANVLRRGWFFLRPGLLFSL